MQDLVQQQVEDVQEEIPLQPKKVQKGISKLSQRQSAQMAALLDRYQAAVKEKKTQQAQQLVENLGAIDSTVNFATDVKLKPTRQLNPAAITAFNDAINAQNQAGKFTADQYDRAKILLSQIQNAGTRKSTDAVDNEIKAFLTDQFAPYCFSLGLNKTLKILFPDYPKESNPQAIVADPDLVACVKKGFQKYVSKNGKESIRLTTRWMFRPGDQASSYDKSVILKAKRIIKRMMSVMQAGKMRADLSLQKDYLSQRAYYNSNRYRFDPTYKMAKIRENAIRYGVTDPEVVRTRKIAGIQDFLTNMDERLQTSINASAPKYATAYQVSGRNPALLNAYKNRVPIYKDYLKSLTKKQIDPAVQQYYDRLNQQIEPEQ